MNRDTGAHDGSRVSKTLAILVTLTVLMAGCLGPAGQSGPADDGPTRTVEHATGETVITGQPETVVALEWDLVENLLALGIQPAGVADVDGYERWVDAGPALEDDVADVGTRQEPSLETIASLEPDLILGVEFRHAEIEGQLSSIAPTLLFDPYPPEDGPDQYERATETFRTVAEAVDRTDRAEHVLEGVNATFQQARASLQEADQAGQDIVLAQAYTQEASPVLRLFTDNALATHLVERVGLQNAWEDGFQAYGFSTVSLEALEQVEDATFLYVAQPDDDPINGTYSDDPAWQNLTFVQEDRVHPLGADVWLFGGPLSAAATANAIVEALAPGGSTDDS